MRRPRHRDFAFGRALRAQADIKFHFWSLDAGSRWPLNFNLLSAATATVGDAAASVTMESKMLNQDRNKRIQSVVRMLKAALKRMKAPKSMQGMIGGLVERALRLGLLNQSSIYPSNDVLASWGRCTRRQAQRNRRELESLGFILPIAHKDGGRGKAPVIVLDFELLIKAMIEEKANPHPDLVKNMRDLIELGALRFNDLPEARRTANELAENGDIKERQTRLT